MIRLAIADRRMISVATSNQRFIVGNATTKRISTQAQYHQSNPFIHKQISVSRVNFCEACKTFDAFTAC
jgi:hypothetical protein